MFLCAQSLIKAEIPGDYFQTAQRLFEKGKYHDAAIAYERVVFKTNTTGIKAKALIEKSICYKKSGDYQKAWFYSK